MTESTESFYREEAHSGNREDEEIIIRGRKSSEIFEEQLICRPRAINTRTNQIRPT